MRDRKNPADSGAAAGVGGLSAAILALFGGAVRNGADDAMRVMISGSDDVARVAVQPADDLARWASLSDDAVKSTRISDFHVTPHLSKVKFRPTREAGDITGHAEVWHPLVDGTHAGLEFATGFSDRE